VFFRYFCRCFIACFKYFILFSDVSKLDRVLHLSPRLSALSPRCHAREGGGSPHWRRAGPTCLKAGVAGETWAGRRGTRNEGQRHGRPDGGLASRRPCCTPVSRARAHSRPSASHVHCNMCNTQSTPSHHEECVERGLRGRFPSRAGWFPGNI
jgi:hypothetical protein